MVPASSSPSRLPEMTNRPSRSACASAPSVRPCPVWDDVVSAVHQPETAIWSRSRSEETRMPSVGIVQTITISSTARCTPQRDAKLLPAVAAISVSPRLARGVTDVPDHDRHDGEHDDDGDGRAAPEVAAAAEHPVEHQVGEDLRVPLAVGHRQHDVEDLED